MSLEATAYGNGKVGLYAAEVGERSSKRTMLTLEPAAAWELANFILNNVPGPCDS